MAADAADPMTPMRTSPQTRKELTLDAAASTSPSSRYLRNTMSARVSDAQATLVAAETLRDAADAEEDAAKREVEYLRNLLASAETRAKAAALARREANAKWANAKTRHEKELTLHAKEKEAAAESDDRKQQRGAGGGGASGGRDEHGAKSTDAGSANQDAPDPPSEELVQIRDILRDLKGVCKRMTNLDEKWLKSPK